MINKSILMWVAFTISLTLIFTFFLAFYPTYVLEKDEKKGPFKSSLSREKVMELLLEQNYSFKAELDRCVTAWGVTEAYINNKGLISARFNPTASQINSDGTVTSFKNIRSNTYDLPKDACFRVAEKLATFLKKEGYRYVDAGMVPQAPDFWYAFNQRFSR